MEKTTVYLPESLKQALKFKARAERRSEADVIREAIAVATAAYTNAPKPRLPLYRGPGNLASRVDELLADGFGRD